MGKPGLSHKKSGAGNEVRTRDLNLGKVALYQLSYSRKKRSPHYMDIGEGVKANSKFLIHIVGVVVVLGEERACIMRAAQRIADSGATPKSFLLPGW